MEENVNLFHYLPYKKYQNFLLFFIPVILVSVISYLYVTSDQWLAGPDSMAYMEMAQSFIQGEGFSIRGSAGLDSTLLFPTGHWPPGYSILISPFILLGMTPYYAGLTVDILCAIGSMVLIFYFYSKFLPFILTLYAGIGTIVWTQGCFADVMSESPFLFFSCLSIFFLNSKCHSVKKQSFLFLLAGLVCGWTAAVRYVGIVLIIAEGLWLILHYNIKQKIIYTLSWLAGVVAAYGWLILHNISVFGAAFPHSDNVRTGSFLVKFMIGLLQFLVSSFGVKKDNLIYILLAFITFLFLIVLVIVQYELSKYYLKKFR